MLKYISIFFFLVFLTKGNTTNKERIIKNLNNTNNIDFNFEQNINGKIESGNCIVEYPRKINCKYNLGNKKILISNGKGGWNSYNYGNPKTKCGCHYWDD